MAERVAAIALDVGDRRIGVAGCDGSGLIATGLGVIHRKKWPDDLAAVKAWIEQRQATQLVVGLPRNMNGSIGFQAQKVQSFVEKLHAALQMPIDFVDERLTTVQAEWNMQAMGIPARKQRDRIDQAAAAVILQQWLDQRRHQLRRAERLAAQRDEDDIEKLSAENDPVQE